jgi:hypothetical protein
MPHASDRYGHDVLSTPRRTTPAPPPEAPADRGLVVEDVETGWCGAVVRCEKTAGGGVVDLEDRKGRVRTFPLGPGFLVEGRPVRLVMPARRPAAPAAPARSASGSRVVQGARARVARGSRIWVEGRHDAELVEKVWGHDLRVEGVVVEQLDGADHLAERLRAFAPGPGRRVGVLLDHMVEGTKEARIAREAVPRAQADHVLVIGHPYIDVWQAIRPERVGLKAWPHVPRGTDIKVGSLAALGLPHATREDIGLGWQKILARVRAIGDLDPGLSGRVEELIDFVTAPEA